MCDRGYVSGAMLSRLVGLLLASTAGLPSPSGAYHARVRTVITQPQDITVVTTRPWRARLELRGPVHFDGEFTFEHVRGEWRAQFSPAMERLLRRYRCHMERFEYDATRDEAFVTIHLPFFGSRAIHLLPLQSDTGEAGRRARGGRERARVGTKERGN